MAGDQMRTLQTSRVHYGKDTPLKEEPVVFVFWNGTEPTTDSIGFQLFPGYQATQFHWNMEGFCCPYVREFCFSLATSDVRVRRQLPDIASFWGRRP